MFYYTLSSLCKSKGTTITALLKKIGLSTSKGTAWRKGSIPNGDILLKISKELKVSIDTLLENDYNSNDYSNTNNVSVSGVNNGVVGHNNSSVTIHNSKDDNNSDFSTQEKDLLRIYNAADGKTQMKIMQFIYGIEENL